MADKIIIIRERPREYGCCSLFAILLLMILGWIVWNSVKRGLEVQERLEVQQVPQQETVSDEIQLDETDLNAIDTGQIESEAITQSEASMRISVWDDTEDNPIRENGEVWIRGIGSWWLRADVVQHGVASKDSTKQSVGYEDYVAVYPDGRASGFEILIPYKLSEGMASDKEMYNLEISIADNIVRVRGEGYRNVSGEYEGTWPRNSKIVPGREAEFNRRRREMLSN